ncbi:MAG: hypothetical protein CL678_17195 [Bdellovibrionaceae bacterium]|nr:hypothetical protein [Pseudobdellovibrionaceae bacterium]|tara:strand:+ start:3148 stop:3615 length:468 start_codon:yes stop_codon:yes gene_type:complete
MKKLFVLVLLFSNSVFANVDLDAHYSCMVTDSSRKQTIGETTLPGYTLNKTINESGRIHGTSVFLYNTVKLYHAYAKNSGYLVIASDFSKPSEFHGTIFITEEPDHIRLDVSIFHSIVLFEDNTGERTRALSLLPNLQLSKDTVTETYVLKCNEV